MSSGRPIRLGELLVERGILSEQQVFEILETQKREGKPFGVLAEMMEMSGTPPLVANFQTRASLIRTSERMLQMMYSTSYGYRQ